MSTLTPIINLKPTNPTQEEFLGIQKFGLQPYDRTPNDYLRFVAKVFTAWRDPNDNILNYDPFDDKYGVSGDTTSTTLQATSDKSIIAYVDGFNTTYNFVRLTVDEASTDLTQTSISNPTTNLETFTTSTGEVITIDKAKYGEYHRFQIKPGICFIDNQLIQITEEVTWWFRVPEVKEISGGSPTFEYGQFIVDPLKVYSLLPNKNYKIILSYEYITQFDSNSARLRFETDDTAVDEPYLLIGSFSTNEYGMVHQTLPINESSVETFKHYVIKQDIDPVSGTIKNYYYLKDINLQYLDKKYMANYKNLFKHLQSQLLSILSETKITNTFHCKEMIEDIHPSCSSGDMVYLDGTTKTWYPAEVSRQDFDRVHGLYLRNANEGTNFLFTSGIIEVDDTYSIMDSENLILRHLIPGAEYFLAEDTNTALNTAPFIDALLITDQREAGIFTIKTEVIAKASNIKITMKQSIDSGLAPFNITRSFNLDPNLGEQRISQSINWEFSASEIAKLPTITFESSNMIQTNKLSFDIELDMVKSSIEETNQEIIEDFKLNDNGDIIIEVLENAGEPNEIIHNVAIEESDLYIKTNGIPNNLLSRGAGGSPVMKLLESMTTKARVNYPALNLVTGDYFVQPNGNIYTLASIQNELKSIVDTISDILYSEEYTNLGFNRILAILGNEVTNIDHIVNNLEEALVVLNENYKAAELVFQSESSDLQKTITQARNQWSVAKDTYDHLVSNIEVVTAKRNSVNDKLLELAIKIQSIKDAKIALNDTMEDIDTLITTYTDIIATINNTISSLQANVVSYQTNVSSANTNIQTSLSNARILENGSFQFGLAYWNIASAVSGNLNFGDLSKVLPRLLHNTEFISEQLIVADTQYAKKEDSKVNFNNASNKYTVDILAGTLNFAEQLLALNNISALKVIYDNDLSEYNHTISNITTYRNIKDLLKPYFTSAKNNIWGELFTHITPNTDPNSSWGDSELTTYTMVISKPYSENLEFEFIFKEDTQSVVRVFIPAGSTTGSTSVYLQSIPDTYVDAGIPKWSCYNNNIPFDIFNINNFNQMLIDDSIFLNGGDINAKYIPILFTLDKTRFNNNPITSSDASINQKPTQTGTKLKDNNELMQIFDCAQSILDNIDARDVNLVNLENTKQLIIQEQNILEYNTNYLVALVQQKSLGISTISIYDSEITYNENLKNWYITTTDNVGLVGSDISYNVAASQLTNMNTLLISVESTLNTKKLTYDASLKALSDATELALGKFLDGITETNTVISEKTKMRQKIIIMHDLYNTRLQIVNTIYENLNSILTSGIFSGEWTTTDTFLLNKFEYQDALENILIDVIDSCVKLPMSSTIIPSILTYTIGTNGLQYPMDLQPWIFIKTSGKISTKKYPGATSIGIALNQNTLLLNIQHRPSGDISEFLNVYGNENDFNDQLMAKYHSAKDASLSLKIGSSLVNINKELVELNTLLYTNPITKTKTINGKVVNITTNLTNQEIAILDLLIQGLSTGNTNERYETQQSIDKKEFLIRLIYSKYYGLGRSFNPFEYIFENSITPSKSSWYDVVGNNDLNIGKDPFNPTETNGKNFEEYIQVLFNSISGPSLDVVTMKGLFLNKLSLYKDLDIINYILLILPEPLIDYNAKFTKLKSDYQLSLQYQLNNSRYILNDDPKNSNDDFENPALSDVDVENNLENTKVEFAGKISSNSTQLNNVKDSITNSKVNHDDIVKRISKFNQYRTFYLSLVEDINMAISYYKNRLSIFTRLKTDLNVQLKSINTEYLSYYSKMNKLPNVMWDIFRITNAQRTKWNYTYLVLRILGMQKELNNVIVNNTIQYSPINAELSELTIKKNAAHTNGDETSAYAYDLEIKALEQKKLNFYNLLQNLINEFNIIQLKYAKQTITPEVALTSDKIINELYMQDPEEYNLSYSFAPYPMYKEI